MWAQGERGTGRRLMLVAAALVCTPAALFAQQVSAGDTLHLRLLDRVRSHHHARPAVHAVVIAPLTNADGRVVIPPGAILSGRMTGSGVERAGGRRHWLGLELDSIAVPLDDAAHDSVHLAIAMRIVAVDDARETTDSAGRVIGPRIPSIVHSKGEWVAAAFGILHPVSAIILAATLEGASKERHRAVSLDAGYELSAVVRESVTLGAWTGWTPPHEIAAGMFADSIIASVPLRASLRREGAPSDIIGLAIIGTEAQLRDALAAAGWTRAAPLSLRSDFVTAVKAVKGEGYAAQPVSELVLGSRPPDDVYEKVADTFVERHHFRVWRWPQRRASDSTALWLVAGTHDTGLMFSKQRESFTHIVDPRIDLERDKIVSDLVAADRVAALSYVRRAAPAKGATVNGGRDAVVTDWRLATVVLK